MPTQQELLRAMLANRLGPSAGMIPDMSARDIASLVYRNTGGRDVAQLLAARAAIADSLRGDGTVEAPAGESEINANQRKAVGRSALRRNMMALAGAAGVSPETLQGRVRGTGDLNLNGPIAPDELRTMVAQSQLRQRMGVDPQAARWRTMLANPAQASDPNADTPDDVARKAALARLTLINGKRVPTEQVTQSMISDMAGQERGKYRTGSDFMVQRAARMKAGSEAASASRAKSADLAYARGALRPTALSASPRAMRDMQIAMANRLAMMQAMQPQGHVRPMDQMANDYFQKNPDVYDAMMRNRAGIEPPAPPVVPVPAPPAVVSGKAKDKGTIVVRDPEGFVISSTDNKGRKKAPVVANDPFDVVMPGW